jgi:hypothetical protein
VSLTIDTSLYKGIRKDKAIKTADQDGMNMSKNINFRFSCVKCMYFSNQNSDVKKHRLTKKHLERTITTSIDPNWKHQCKGCNKKYNSQSALWYHNKKCKVTTLIDPNWKHQCKGCNKKYNSQSALWYHNKKCKALVEPSS